MSTCCGVHILCICKGVSATYTEVQHVNMLWSTYTLYLYKYTFSPVLRHSLPIVSIRFEHWSPPNIPPWAIISSTASRLVFPTELLIKMSIFCLVHRVMQSIHFGHQNPKKRSMLPLNLIYQNIIQYHRSEDLLVVYFLLKHS